jgi:hypothetical protein
MESPDLYSYTTVVSDSHYQSTLDAVYVYVVPWSQFPIVPSFSDYPHSTSLNAAEQTWHI